MKTTGIITDEWLAQLEAKYSKPKKNKRLTNASNVIIFSEAKRRLLAKRITHR